MSLASWLAGAGSDERYARRRYEDDLHDLCRLGWEGMYRLGEVEDMLRAVHDDEPLGDVARDSGPIVSRYCAMRRELNRIRAPELQPQVDALSEIFDYLSQLLHHSVALLAVGWRSERLREQQELVGPIGRQGERLREIVAELDRLEKGWSSLDDQVGGAGSAVRLRQQ
jgi:hypothetical protein